MTSPLNNRLIIEWCLAAFARILVLILLPGLGIAYSQCNNSTLFPTNPVIASSFNDTVVVSNLSNAGQYYQVKNLALNQSYVFTGKAGDFITIRNIYTNAVLGYGPAPYTYAVGSGPDVVNVHINLIQSCGLDLVPRTTALACPTCPPLPPGTGINKAVPQATLDLGGELKLGNASRPPQAGMVRWNPDSQDFEGYNGSEWLSLTKSNASTGQWGQLAADVINENGRFSQTNGTKGYYSIDISGDYAIVGARGDSAKGFLNTGAAYVFIRNGDSWEPQAKLFAAFGSPGDRFGDAVSISGDYGVIGAPLKDNIEIDQGSAYFFVRNGSTWTQQAEFQFSNIGSDYENVQFGKSVSISGDYAIIGAPNEAIGTTNPKIYGQGAAYIYKRTGSSWALQAKITASDGASGDRFGYSVSITGDYVMVGALNDAVGTNAGQGSVYFFLRSGSSWTQQSKLVAADGGPNEQFGSAISVDSNYMIVGAPVDNIGANAGQGSAYVFIRNGNSWTQQAKLTSLDGAALDGFGTSVDITNGNAIVGAPNRENGLATGAVYLFTRNNTSWTQTSKFLASDGGVSDYLGGSNGVCLDSDFAITLGRGKAYLIQKK